MEDISKNLKDHHAVRAIREVTSRLILRNGVEWGLKGGVLVKNASNSYIDILVKLPFLRTFPGGQ